MTLQTMVSGYVIFISPNPDVSSNVDKERVLIQKVFSHPRRLFIVSVSYLIHVVQEIHASSTVRKCRSNSF